MNDAHRPPWLAGAVLAGVLYAVVGIVFSLLAGAAASQRGVLLWRWAAFAISGAVFLAHILIEHERRRPPATGTAWRVAVGVAAGGFGLALWANLHELGSTAGYRPRMVIALVAWPLLTAVPAYLVALAAAVGLARVRPRP